MTAVGPNQQPNPDVFWGEISPSEHCVQVYDHEDAFMDSLEAFVASGLRKGDSVILIMTAPHLDALEQRLIEYGVDLNTLRTSDQYITLDADDTLGQFMVDNWPDDARFEAVVSSLLGRARSSGRRVRAFGEMVALLWERGHNGATLRLEHLWHSLCESKTFPLFCAYPRSGFTKDAHESIAEICAAHSRVVQ